MTEEGTKPKLLKLYWSRPVKTLEVNVAVNVGGKVCIVVEKMGNGSEVTVGGGTCVVL